MMACVLVAATLCWFATARVGSLFLSPEYEVNIGRPNLSPAEQDPTDIRDFMLSLFCSAAGHQRRD
jgi:hypothetical protein